MEAAIRTLYYAVNQCELGEIDVQAVRGNESVREATIEVGGDVGTLRVAIVHGLRAAGQMAEAPAPRRQAGAQPGHHGQDHDCQQPLEHQASPRVLRGQVQTFVVKPGADCAFFRCAGAVSSAPQQHDSA